ncbi:hypothetical protein Tco_0179142 [Tanacetum coccineum]
MTTLAEHIIAAGAENHPPILEKSMYDSWESHIRLFIKRKKHDDCDVHATNIILHGLPPDVYALVNHQKEAKDIWDKVKLLMKGTELSYQKRECKLYNLFDKFASVQGETLYEYYWRFSQLIHDMHTIGMTMQQVQVNTKFLNAIPPEWSKFVTDVKLAKSLYTTNYDQLGSDANLSSCDSDVLSEVPYSVTYPNEMINPDVQEMLYFEQTHIVNFPDDEIKNDSNIIPYSQYLHESQDAGIQDTNSSTPNDLLDLSLVKQITHHVANLDKQNQTNKMVNESLTAKLERYKERVTIFEQIQNVDLNKHEKLIDSQMDDIIRNRNAKLVAFQ